MNDTDDVETKEVLKHIGRSLRKNYPFVDVFLPLQTNAQNLIRKIQTNLKPSKNPHIANHCGLTQSSRLTLGGELQHRLQELRRDMTRIVCTNGSDQQMGDICATLEIFQYFDQYVGSQDTRDAMQQAKFLLETFVGEQIGILKKGMEKGTGPNHDFGSADINGMKGACTRLQELEKKYPDLVDCQDMEVKMNKRMTEFHESLKVRLGDSFIGMHRNLSKLKLWSSMFPQYVQVYEGVTNHLASLIQQSADQCEALEIDGNFLKLSHEELYRLFQILAVLHSINQDEEDLSYHGLDTQRVSHVYMSAVKNMRLRVKGLKKMASEEMKTPQLDDRILRDVVSLFRTIEHLEGLLVQFPICPKLMESVGAFCRQLSENLIEYIETLVDGDSLEGIEHPEIIKGILRQTKLASEELSGTEDELSRHISIINADAVNTTKSHLMKRLGEIEHVIRDVEKNGIKDGAENARILIGLRTMCWLDSFLPDDTKFVGNFCIEVERIFQDRINQVRSRAEIALRQIADENHDLVFPAKSFTPILSELGQISQFATEVKTVGLELKMEEEARNELYRIVTSFVEKYGSFMEEWRNLFTTEECYLSKARVDEVTEKLERALREINALLGLDPECDSLLNMLHSRLKDAMHNVSTYLKNTMEESEKYEEKFRLLQIVNSVTKFSLVSQNLPRFEDLQLVARNTVASDAEKIQDLVSQTSEWDKIDSILDQFQKATLLDEFTWKEATSRIIPLLKFREQKQEEVDNLLDRMIADEDFEGIGVFLLP